MKSFMMLIRVLGFVLVFVLIKGNSPAFAQYNADPLSSLEGIKSVYIEIRPIKTNMDIKDEMQRRLLRQTEEAFRRAEIEMLSEEDYVRLRRSRYYPLGRFSISVEILDAEHLRAKIYHVAVHLDQRVFLSRTPVIQFTTPTWEMEKIGYSGDLGAVYNLVDNIVARFVHDFLSVNADR